MTSATPGPLTLAVAATDCSESEPLQSAAVNPLATTVTVPETSLVGSTPTETEERPFRGIAALSSECPFFAVTSTFTHCAWLLGPKSTTTWSAPCVAREPQPARKTATSSRRRAGGVRIRG